MHCALLFRCIGDGLPYPLMRPCLVKVRTIRPEHAPQLALDQDEEVVKVLTPDAAEESLTMAFARGARMGIRSTSIRLPAATRANCAPNLPSLSRIRNRFTMPKGVASRSCWATQASVGCRVTPTWMTRREPEDD